MKLRLARKVVQQPTAWIHRKRAHASAVARVEKKRRCELRTFRNGRKSR